MARSLLYLVGLVVVLLAVEVYALTDPTTDYQMISASSSSAPESARCLSPQCRNIRLTCPTHCKKRATVAPGASACFIDCLNCKASCKHRKLNCYGFGAVCYDPRFIGGDGVMFYFHGQMDQDFCLVSDRNLHVNAHFIGKRPEGRTRDYTWVQSLGIMFDSHKLTVAAKKVGKWNDDVDQFSFSYDGADFALPQFDGALWTSTDGQVVIGRTSQTNSAYVTINELMEVSLDVVSIGDQESRVHNYQITDEDRFAHLQMQFIFFGLSPSVDGVLGQTYQPNFKTPVKVGVPMPIMGGDEKYLSSSLLTADCKVNQFSIGHDGSEVDASPVIRMPIQCNNKDGVMSCRR